MPYSECTRCRLKASMSRACTCSRVISSRLPFMPPVSMTTV